MKNIYNYNKC